MRLIDAESLKAKFKDPVTRAFVTEMIDNEPTVDAVERKRGRWVHSEDKEWCGGGKTTCTTCGWSYSDGAYHEVYEFNFCPNCGADMRGESE